MTKLPIVACFVLTALGGVAGSGLAVTSASAAGYPSCQVGNHVKYDVQMDILSKQLDLAVKPGSSIGVAGGCIEVTTIQHGKVSMDFYDPESLSLVAHF